MFTINGFYELNTISFLLKYFQYSLYIKVFNETQKTCQRKYSFSNKIRIFHAHNETNRRHF
jgi:hypothetical protein